MKETLDPIEYLGAANLTAANTFGFDYDDAYVNANATAYPNGVETSKWGGFVCHVSILSYDGTPTMFFKVQHSAVDPSTVSYDPWKDLVKFPPISTVGRFTVEVPNEGVAQFGRWVRVVWMGMTAGTATLGDIVLGPRE